MRGKDSEGGEVSFEGTDDPYDAVEKDGAPSHGHVHYPHTEKSALQVGTVALLVFFTVSGGPMGSEDAVRAILLF